MVDNDNLVAIGRKDVEELVSSFVPMFKWLDDHGVNYCLVGGLGVLLHSYNSGLDTFRATTDADIMFDATFTNRDFAKAYLEVYASDPRYGKAVYEAVFGGEAFDALGNEAQALINASFIGASIDLDGVSTPDFDVVRSLNEVDLASIEKETVSIADYDVKVASAKQLLEMKERTIRAIRTDFSDSPRPQDFVDANRLRRIIENISDAAKR